MAERSKALASGASLEIGVGSNPTLVNIIFAFCLSRRGEQFGVSVIVG